MSERQYDLAVAYRIYPKVSAHAPPLFQDDKFKLAELCLRSFKDSLTGLRVKLWALLDNCPPAYEALFQQLWAPEDLVLNRYPAVGDAATFREQTRILMQQTDAEIVYLAEDDYFYLPNQFQMAVDFLKKNPDADFASPYDHPDNHNTGLHRGKKVTRKMGDKQWSSCLSTTHTFLTRRGTLTACQGVFLASYGKISPDLAKWMALTKRHVFNPFKFAAWSCFHRFWAASIFFAWRYCWRQILFGRAYNLWIPQPTIATHMVAGLEAPGFDWPNEFRTKALAYSITG